MSDNSFTSYIVPSLMTGAIVLLDDIFGSGYLIDSPFLWIDVGSNVLAYMSSKLVLEFSFDKMFSDAFLENGFNLVFQPVVHGGINGVISHFSVEKPSIRGLSQYVQRGRLPVEEHMTFTDGFIKGVSVNVMGTYLSQPLLQL